MRTLVAISAVVFLMLSGNNEVQAKSEVSAPDTPARILNEMKGPPMVMQDELIRLLQPEIDRGYITIHTDKGKVRVSLASTALFDSGSDQVHARGVDILMRVGSVLKVAPNWEATLTGHADNQPIKPALQKRFPSNMELSEARAQSGARILMEAGVDPGAIVITGKGESYPIASNATPEGRSKNRRIELQIEPRPAIVASETSP